MHRHSSNRKVIMREISSNCKGQKYADTTELKGNIPEGQLKLQGNNTGSTYPELESNN